MAPPLVKCDGHDELVAAAARGTAMFEEHSRQLSGIFDNLEDIRTLMESNRVRADFRDKSLMEVSEGILEVDKKIENGLRAEVRDMKSKLARLAECIERRKAEREAAIADREKRGLYGFLRPGWEKFKQESSFIAVSFIIIGGLSFLLWAAGKITIFKEPLGFLKLFGIG